MLTPKTRRKDSHETGTVFKKKSNPRTTHLVLWPIAFLSVPVIMYLHIKEIYCWQLHRSSPHRISFYGDFKEHFCIQIGQIGREHLIRNQQEFSMPWLVVYTYVETTTIANTLNNCYNLLTNIQSPRVAFVFEHTVFYILQKHSIRDSSVGTVIRLWAGRLRNRGSILGRSIRFFMQVLRFSQPCIWRDHSSGTERCVDEKSGPGDGHTTLSRNVEIRLPIGAFLYPRITESSNTVLLYKVLRPKSGNLPIWLNRLTATESKTHKRKINLLEGSQPAYSQTHFIYSWFT